MNKNKEEIDSDYTVKWPCLKDSKHLVLCTNDFVVFIDNNIDVDWETSEKYDEKGPENLEKHHLVINRSASLECIPNEHQKENIRINFKRMIAEGIARALDHDYENASKILDDAEIYIRNRNIEIARYWQLSSSCLIGIISAIIALFLWYFRGEFILHLGSKTFFIIISSLLGSIGATLSIIFRIGNTISTSEAEQKLHVLEAISRNMGGAISGLIVSILVSLGVIVPMFKTVGMTNLAMLAGGLLAGASERLAPSLVAQFEKGVSLTKKGEK